MSGKKLSLGTTFIYAALIASVSNEDLKKKGVPTPNPEIKHEKIPVSANFKEVKAMQRRFLDKQTTKQNIDKSHQGHRDNNSRRLYR